MDGEKMPYDIFISYASIDLNLAEKLVESLSNEKFKIWFDKARLEPGFNWHKEIEQGCENSRIVLPVLTPRWKLSDWTKFETYGAEEVIPLVFEGEWEEVKTAPLERFQAEKIDFKVQTPDSWEKLIHSINMILLRTAPDKTKRTVNLRYRANEYFYGREKEINQIHEELHCNPQSTLTQGRVRAICAMGGAGKTTLVRHYAEKFWRCYESMFWVDGRAGYENEFANIHDILFPDRSSIGLMTRDKALSAVHELNSMTIRLLILDNAEDEEDVMHWIPKSGGCHTLITSRFTGFSSIIKTIHIFVLEEEPSIEFLQKRSKYKAKGEELKACRKLAEKLGWLPLALEQAAAYIEQQPEGFGFIDYLRLYNDTYELLETRVLGSTEYPKSVAATWLPTIEKLPHGARSILRLSSFLAIAPITIDMLLEGENALLDYISRYSENKTERISNVEFWVRKQIQFLKAYSMIKDEYLAYSLHPLLQTVQFLNHGAGKDRWLEDSF